MKPLASGDYSYWRDGERQAISEPWSLSVGDLGLHLHGQRLLDGKLVLEVAADYQGRHCLGMALTWFAASTTRSVIYEMRGETLQWRLDDATDSRIQPLPQGCELFPLLRVAAGPLVQQLLELRRAVVVPNIRPNASEQELLSPLMSERHASLLGHNGEERHCRYYGGEYGTAGSEYWLDARGLLQRYRWESDHGIWEARLEGLRMTAEFAGFG